ncbi:MAG: N-formylglutamate amidohydrolase [Cyanobacteria bacterium J06638_28]
MQPFHLYLPKAAPCPIVANIPHSGLAMPLEIAQTLNHSYQRYLPHQDWHLDQLYDLLPNLGITVLQAIYSRYVVDLNRAAQEPLFGDFWQSTIPAKTAFNMPLYRIRPLEAQIRDRIDQFYNPYHQQLEALLNQMIQQFGYVYLLDLHSFGGPIKDDVCLGNINGESCSEFLSATVESSFLDHGYQVVRNKVFNGGYITRHYGQMPQVEALQIELRYPTYLNEKQLKQNAVPDWDVPEFHQAKSRINTVFETITNVCRAHSSV